MSSALRFCIYEFDRLQFVSVKELFEQFSGDHYEFNKNHVSVKLSQHTQALSRSEAKRLLFGLDKFREIAFDFSGVKEIGQAFADKIFRVYAKQHPQIRITFLNASPAVGFMITKTLREGAF